MIYRMPFVTHFKSFPAIPAPAARQARRFPAMPFGVNRPTKFFGLTPYNDGQLYGDTLWVKPGSGLVYGEMYMTNGAQVVTVAAANTAYEVDGGFTVGELNEVTYPDDHFLKIGKAGMYLATWNMSIDTTAANDEVEGGIMQNDAVLAPDKGTSHATISAVAEASCISASAIFEAAVDDEISLYLRNHTAARDITVEHASLILVQIGGPT